MDLRGLFVVLKGLASYTPLNALLSRCKGLSHSAHYCYSVWLTHLQIGSRAGQSVTPRVVAELGPGASVGLGVAALLSGSEKYYALDIVPFADVESSERMLDEMVRLYQERADLHPFVGKYLEDLSFPHSLIDSDRLVASLHATRVDQIRRAIKGLPSGEAEGVEMRYVVPWTDQTLVPEGAANLVLSQAVLEHVDEIEPTYHALQKWLNPTGWMSHQIDYRSHNMASSWDGHWTYSDAAWKLIRGRRPYLLNRRAHSEHLQMMRDGGFKVIEEAKISDDPVVPQKSLGAGFQHLTEDDRHTAEAFIVAVHR